jgi:hypothetical protein
MWEYGLQTLEPWHNFGDEACDRLRVMDRWLKASEFAVEDRDMEEDPYDKLAKENNLRFDSGIPPEIDEPRYSESSESDFPLGLREAALSRDKPFFERDASEQNDINQNVWEALVLYKSELVVCNHSQKRKKVVRHQPVQEVQGDLPFTGEGEPRQGCVPGG